MDKKIEKFQTVLTTVLGDYAKQWNASTQDEPKYELLIDKEKRHYQLQTLGWRNGHFVHSIPFYFEIKNNKIWLQINNTDILITDDLVEHGIEKSDIVLGFQPEHRRPYTGFATA